MQKEQHPNDSNVEKKMHADFVDNYLPIGAPPNQRVFLTDQEKSNFKNVTSQISNDKEKASLLAKGLVYYYSTEQLSEIVASYILSAKNTNNHDSLLVYNQFFRYLYQQIMYTLSGSFRAFFLQQQPTLPAQCNITPQFNNSFPAATSSNLMYPYGPRTNKFTVRSQNGHLTFEKQNFQIECSRLNKSSQNSLQKSPQKSTTKSTPKKSRPGKRRRERKRKFKLRMLKKKQHVVSLDELWVEELGSPVFSKHSLEREEGELTQLNIPNEGSILDSKEIDVCDMFLSSESADKNNSPCSSKTTGSESTDKEMNENYRIIYSSQERFEEIMRIFNEGEGELVNNKEKLCRLICESSVEEFKKLFNLEEPEDKSLYQLESKPLKDILLWEDNVSKMIFRLYKKIYEIVQITKDTRINF
jgi:hypothetical protein